MRGLPLCQHHQVGQPFLTSVYCWPSLLMAQTVSKSILPLGALYSILTYALRKDFAQLLSGIISSPLSSPSLILPQYQNFPFKIQLYYTSPTLQLTHKYLDQPGSMVPLTESLPTECGLFCLYFLTPIFSTTDVASQFPILKQNFDQISNIVIELQLGFCSVYKLTK